MTIGTPQKTSGSYRVLRQLGARTHATHAAIREPGQELVVIQRFDRRVAIDDGATRYASDAVGREARCLTKNWHANVARVRHVDVSESELTIATELIDGITFEDLLRAGRVAPPMLLRVVLDVLAGLSHIHALRDETNGNIPLAAVHGAVCPRNVVLGKDGVARLVATFRPRPIRVDAQSEWLTYAAPEAIEESTSDARTDLYSVGVMMWEGLQGRALFGPPSPSSDTKIQTPPDVLHKQREEDIKWEADAASIVARLGAVVLRALSFDPALRFRSATEMTAAIRRAAGTEIATGSRVAHRVVEVAGDRLRTRRTELDPRTTSGKMHAVSVDEPPPTTKGAPPSSDRRGAATKSGYPSSKKMPVTAPMIVRTPPSAMKPVPLPNTTPNKNTNDEGDEPQDVTMSMPNAPLAQTVEVPATPIKDTTAAMPGAPVAKVVIAPTASKGGTKELPQTKPQPPQQKLGDKTPTPFGDLRSPSDMMLVAKKAPAPVEPRAADLFARPPAPKIAKIDKSSDAKPGEKPAAKTENVAAEKSDAGWKPQASPTAAALRDPSLPKTVPMREVAAKTKLSPQVSAPKAEAKVEAPKVEAPKVEAPKVEAPKVEAPKVEAPKVEAPKVEAPKVEAPKVEAPKVEAPKVEAPKVEAPKVEAPKVEAPKVEAPKVEAPKVEAPKVDEANKVDDGILDDEEAALVSIPPTPTEKTPNKALNVTAPMPRVTQEAKASPDPAPSPAPSPADEDEEKENAKKTPPAALLFLQRGLPLKMVMRLVGIAALLTIIAIVIYLKSGATNADGQPTTQATTTRPVGSGGVAKNGSTTPSPPPTESVGVIAADEFVDASAADPNGGGTGVGFYGMPAGSGSASAAPFDPTIAVPAPTTSSSPSAPSKKTPYEPLGI